MCGGAVGDFFASFDDMVHNTVESTLAQAKFYITHPLEAVEVAALMYFGVPPSVAMATTSYANGHGSVQQVGISVVQAYVGSEMGSMSIDGVPPEMMNVITSASSSAAVAAIQGKPLNQILTAGLSGSVKGLVMNELSSQGLDVKSFSNKAISDAVGNASNAILNGQSIGDAIAMSASKSLVSKGMQEASSQLGSMWNDIYKKSETLQGLGDTFNTLKSDVTSTWEQLQSNAQGATNVLNSANSLLETANNFTNLANQDVAAYEQAKYNSEHPDEYLAKVAPNQFRIHTQDDGEGGTYRGFQQVYGTNEDGSPAWGWTNLQEVNFEGVNGDQIAERQRNLASVHANNANNRAESARAYGDIYAKQVGYYNDFVASSVTPLDKAYTEKVGTLTALKDQITSLDEQTRSLSTSFADKYKSYQELEKEFGAEIAQQIASKATEALKSQPSTLQIGDFVETGFGQEVTLSDGTKGKITNTGEVIAADKPSDIIPVVDKTPTGSVTLSNDTESNEIINPGNVTKPELTPKEVYESYLKEGFSEERAREASEYTPSIDDEKDDFRVPVDVSPTPPLTPNPADQKTGAEFYDALIAQGVEPALATKMSGHTPSGGPGALPTGTPGEPSGPGGPSGLPTGTPGGPGGPGGPGVLPTVPPLTSPTTTQPTTTQPTTTIPTAQPLDPLVVSGKQEPSFDPWDNPEPPPDEVVPTAPTPTTPVKTPTTAVGTVTSPKTPTTTSTTTTPKTPGALPTATTTETQASSGYSAPSSGTSQSGGIPTPITGQSLAAAPVYANTQILQQLKQLDPKLLSMIAPQLSGQSGPTGLSALSPQIPQQATGGNMQQSNPYNTLFQTMLADKGGTNPSYGAPMFSAASSMLGYASGGGAKMDDYLTHLKKLRDKEQTGALMSSGLKLLGAPAYNTMGFKDGGHIPEFKTGTTGHYVKGAGDGQSDDIPAMLADGEYVFDADTVASLGNGSSDAGAQLLDHFREAAREHKRSAPVDKIPPKASPLAYMKEALKRHARG